MSIINVGSVEEAVKIAKDYSSTGKKYWFRGQTHNWEVQSSYVRMKESKRENVSEKLDRFHYWVTHTPGLESIANNQEAIIAVAQHYGLATNFIDFTISVDVAAFFATEKIPIGSKENTACIICIDVEDFLNVWNMIRTLHEPPKLIEISVPNLWRLEAQKGVFIECPYDHVERIYDFDRICFPLTHKYSVVINDQIYPLRKSNLEILLDQYFMNERMIDSTERMHKFAIKHNFERIRLEIPTDRIQKTVFPSGISDHETWGKKEIKQWLVINNEQLKTALTKIEYTLTIDTSWGLKETASIISKQSQTDLFGLDGIRHKLVNWSIELIGDLTLPSDFKKQVQLRLTKLWDGVRNIPYSNLEISEAIGMCISMAISLKGDFNNNDRYFWKKSIEECLDDPIEVEFGVNDGSYSRGYVSRNKLQNAIRNDLGSFIGNERKSDLLSDPRRVLLAISDPKKVFDYHKLTSIFISEIIPFQVLARNEAIFYTPARLDAFGLP